MSDLISSIIEICRLQNITQRELAKKSGLTETSISRYFNGERSPNIKNAEKMASVLGLRIALINTGVINITVSDDVCVWRIVDRPNNLPIYNTSCGKIRLQCATGVDIYCNGCGKKIKVVE